ncbi:hypothetical protein GCM10027051_29780 [Niabella terrae]
MANKKLKVGNVPNLRFPEFTEEWETKKLGEILEFKNGINATKEQYGSGYKVCCRRTPTMLFDGILVVLR